MAPIIVWFRHDLRLHDHEPLAAAAALGCPIIPVFVLDDETPGPWAYGGAARWWLHHSLDALHDALAGCGCRLVLRRGRFATIIPQLARETGAEAVHVGVALEPWARAADAEVTTVLATQRNELRRFRTATLFDPDAVRTRAGASYAMFKPFAQACLDRPPPEPLPAPTRLQGAPVPSDDLAAWGLLPTSPDWAAGLRATWRPGETSAIARLREFVANGLADYAGRRDQLGEDGTSMLSPHLHWGELSAAQMWAAAASVPAGPGRSAWRRELLWREFAAHLLWHHPTMPDQPLRPAFAALPWRSDQAALRAWQRGRTGVPVVDAAMRQLWRTGWMHNRTRMTVASFLAKHLLISWQDGETWFWDTLVDADLANNAANWQWMAGCGANAAPFFRVFNPVLQGRKFDPDGAYVRRWVPELAALDAAHIHAPWDAPEMTLRSAGVELGTTYPRPIVDLAAGRARALAAFRQISDTSAGAVAST